MTREFMKIRREVWLGRRRATKSGLTKSAFTLSKRGEIVSRIKQRIGKALYRTHGLRKYRFT